MDDSKKLSPEVMTKKVINFLKYGGCSPKDRTIAANIIGCLYIFYSVSMIFLAVFNFFVNPPESFGAIVLESTMLFGFIQVAAKYYTPVKNHKILSDMLDTVWIQFWGIDLLEDNKKKESIKLYKLAKVMCHVYTVLVLTAGLLVIAQVGFNRSLVIEIWTPRHDLIKITPYYEIVFTCQAVLLMNAAVFCVIPLDQLFILLFFFVCVQFKIIRAEILNALKGEKPTNLKHIIEHHNVLIRFIRNLDEVFSELILVNIVANYITLTMTMYGTAVEESLNKRVTNIFIYSAMLCQIFAYCLAGQLIQDEALLIGEAAYNCNWQNIDDNAYKKNLILIIARAQRKIQITAGGFMNLNMESFLGVIQTTFSFFAFIVNVRK